MVRPATARDAAAVRALVEAGHEEAGLDAGALPDLDDVDAAYFARGGSLELLVDEEGMVGCIALAVEGERAEIKRLAVDPRARGQGVGRTLVRRALDEAARRGASEVVAETHPSLASAVRLYEKLGFAREGEGDPKCPIRFVARVVAEARGAYAPRWCEENAVRLARSAAMAARDPRVAFVTSDARATPMRLQRAALVPDEPVLWDYHVFVIARGDDGAWCAWDLDTTHRFPAPLDEYLALTFADAPWTAPRFQPRFRAVPVADLEGVFSSDRSHMLAPGGGYLAPLPPWPRLGEGESTLMRFLERGDFVGEELNLDALRARFTEETP
jgi:ribosomal protein S18 acetylase RimI-like enzyme